MLRIRRARPEDCPRLGEIYVDAWRDTYPGLVPSRVLRDLCPRSMARRMRASLAGGARRERVYVAEDNRLGPVGLATVGRNPDAGLPYLSELYTLYVDPGAYGLGAGSALLDRVRLDEAARRAPSLLIWVLAGNPARFFYEARGGRLVAARVLHRWGVALPALGYGFGPADEPGPVAARRGRAAI